MSDALDNFTAEIIERDRLQMPIERKLKIVCWHVQGVKRIGFRRIFQRLIEETEASIAVIVETQISWRMAENFLNSLSFGRWIKVDTMGCAGGIWILCIQDDVKITLNHSCFNEICCSFKIVND